MSITRFQRVIALLVVALAAATLAGAGRLVTREDPLQKADAIYVLGGSWIQRSLEAVDLFHEGLAPRIVLSRDAISEGELELQRRGVRLPGAAEDSRRIMIDQLKIPAAAIEILPEHVDNTAQEAEAIKPVVAERRWHRLIVITDRASTRRAGFAMRRVLGRDTEIVMRAPRYDRFPPAGWWKRRADFRTLFYELPKLVAYWLGLKG